jgi:hypothetical protein
MIVAKATRRQWIAGLRRDLKARDRENRDQARAATAVRGKRLKQGHTHPSYIIGIHWLSVAYERICAGESEVEVLRDYGYHYMPPVKS